MEKPHVLQTILQEAFQCYPGNDGALTIEGGDLGDVLAHLKRCETEGNREDLNAATSKVTISPTGALVFPLVRFAPQTNAVRTVYSEFGGRWLVEVLSDEQKYFNGGRYRVVRLRCLSTLRKPSIIKDIPEGHIWEAQVREGYETYAGWCLRPDLLKDIESCKVS